MVAEAAPETLTQKAMFDKHRFSYQIIVPKISAVLRTVAGDMFPKESLGFK
jgi:hypothetical protein